MDYHIPKKDKAFSLGGSPGKKTLYFIVSKQPDVELESRYNQILYARSIKTQASESETEMVASRAFEDEVLSRDITDIVYDPIPEQKSSPVYEINEAGKRFTVIRDRLLSCDGCVSRVTYELK
ncbi:MAG: hypothetical protein ABFS56_26460 [Pseudomonadota bacterium]